MTLTREQRRMVVEHFATQCAEDMPSDDMPDAEFYQDLHSEEWRLGTMRAIEKVIPEQAWKHLVESISNYLSFDRDAEGWREENGYTLNLKELRDMLEDNVSAAIDAAARY